jgi:hypothetical protein
MLAVAIFLSFAFILVSEMVRVNSKDGSALTIIHTYAVQVCFHRRPLNGITSLYWNISCHEYYTYPASPDSSKPITNVDTVLLRDTEYWIGVSLLEPDSTATDTINFAFGVHGDDCPFGTVYVTVPTPSCVLPQNITPTEGYPVNMTLEEVRFFSFYVPSPNVASISAFSTNGASLLIFVIRYMSTPTNLHHDGEAGSTAFFAYPRPGRYFLRVRAAQNVTDYSFALRFEFCNHTNSTTGPGCNTFYNVSNNWLEVPTRAKVPRFWELFVPANSLASVSIRPDDGDLWNYQLFASKGQLPQPKNADISNCYGSGCTGVLTINITTLEQEDTIWFIGVIPVYSNKTYGIWFNSICAPGCTEHGLCQLSGPLIGKCVCAADFIGAGCQISDTLSAQYIVLIIIACLLFTSGIVGFIAQAYLKRKGYQNI